MLEDGERLIGLKSKIVKGYEPEQLDVVFIIGKVA
jgi:hypothetical protein